MISAPTIHTDILWDLSVLFVILSGVYFLSIFFFRNRFLKKSADTSRRKNMLAPLVSEFLFYQEQEGSKEEKNSYIQKKIEIRELIKDPENEKVLTEILLDLKKDVSGDTRKQLFKLYKDLNLEIRAFEKLKSWKWQKISQAMFELTQMQVAASYDFISGFINDKRSVIRKQAEISLVTLDHKGICYFLDTTKYQISEWQQLKILEVLSNHEDFEAPRFYKWLTSKNKHVVLFALRLIKHYDQDDSRGSIITLARHKNSTIKLEAINCIKQFYILDAIPILKTIFWANKPNVKLAILDTLAELGDTSEISFLLMVSEKESNFTVKSKASSAINTIEPEYIIPTEDIELFDEGDTANLDLRDTSETLNDDEKAVEITVVDDLDREASAQVLTPQEDIIDIMFATMVEFVPKDLSIHEKLVDKEITEAKVAHVIEENSLVLSIEEIPFEEEIAIIIKDVKGEKLILEDQSAIEAPIISEIDSVEVSENEASIYLSIFKSLFEKSDDDCKLLLLDEMLSLADENDLAFLNSLQNHPNSTIKSKVDRVQTALRERLQLAAAAASEMVNSAQQTISNISESTAVIQGQELSTKAEEKKLELSYFSHDTIKLKSLEYCFLEDESEDLVSKSLGIFDLNFEVEITSEQLRTSLSSMETVKPIKHEQGLTQEEHGFFQQLLDFPATVIDKLHG